MSKLIPSTKLGVGWQQKIKYIKKKHNIEIFLSNKYFNIINREGDNFEGIKI